LKLLNRSLSHEITPERLGWALQGRRGSCKANPKN
jgi:hypothetical protein